MSKSNLILVFCLVLGFILRSVWISHLPVGFTPDEAALGYNAFTLLATGKDEWGTDFWQLPFANLKSFGDYKLPLYSFLAVPTVKAFGLNEFSVRLPNSILGSLSVIGIYLLGRRLLSRSAANFAALLFAVSPWSIQMSRMALEANLIILFLPLAIYAWASRRYIVATLLLSLNFYTYHSARVLTLLSFPLLFSLFRPTRSSLVKIVVVALLLMAPGLFSLAGTGSVRSSDVAIYSPTDSWGAVADRRFEGRINGLPDSISRLFSNKLIATFSVFTKNYLSYLSPQFLFTSGAGESTYGIMPGRGLLYYIELPLILAFLVLAVKHPVKSRVLLILFLLLSIVPAALAKGYGFSANRTALMLPFLTLMTSSGLAYLLFAFRKFRPLLYSGFLVLVLASVFFFAEDYIFHSPRILAKGMNHGIKEAFSRVQDLSSSNPTVYFSRSLSEPHIYAAFYWQIDPVVYQQALFNYSSFQSQGYKFLDQYPEITIGSWTFGDLSLASPGLQVGRPTNFPENYPEHFHLNFPDGTPSIKVSEVRSKL